ncbi:MAG: DUF2391 family protein [Myxococcota bacterium]|nr:DUF2391 family protein [Myxococcota bacterium]
MADHDSQDHSIIQVGGRLHRLTPIVNRAGQVVHHAVTPLMVEIKSADLIQILVGAAVLSVPVSLTEEAWNLAEQLSTARIGVLAGVSLGLIAAFVYCNFYRHHLREHLGAYVTRVLLTFAASFFVAGLLLTLLDRCPWGTDDVLALKRIVIVAFPASMSAALSDSIR